jgi:hypothetical protein
MIILSACFLPFGGLVVKTINNSPGFLIHHWGDSILEIVRSENRKI